jgi:hypothetical protein
MSDRGRESFVRSVSQVEVGGKKESLREDSPFKRSVTAASQALRQAGRLSGGRERDRGSTKIARFILCIFEEDRTSDDGVRLQQQKKKAVKDWNLPIFKLESTNMKSGSAH